MKTLWINNLILQQGPVGLGSVNYSLVQVSEAPWEPFRLKGKLGKPIYAWNPFPMNNLNRWSTYMQVYH